ncbi:MAG TPA: hypothetical protein VG276_30795 [Actinomycetes bacterium]|nr:hypothetical protein [Actinomycetes bacterium]
MRLGPPDRSTLAATSRERAGPAAPDRRPARRPAALLVVGAAALLILAPLLGPGYVLSYDMVFVPRIPFTWELLGLGTSVARAVPSDLLVAVASRLLPADLVQKLVLAGILAGGGWGAARLAPTASSAGQAAAGVLYVWNAFVYERLLIGHWALLVSYAALPWVARAAAALRLGPGGGRLAAWLAVAACGSPPGGVVASVTALLVACCPPWSRRAGTTGPDRERPAAASPLARLRLVAPRPGRERRVAASPLARLGRPGGAAGPDRERQGPASPLARLGLVAAAALVLNAPWLVPSVLRPGGVPYRPAGVDAFAARPDGPLGSLGSLATLGGIWNADVVPPGRGSWLWMPAFALIAVLAVAGWRRIPDRLGRGAAVGLVAAAALGLAVAAASGGRPGLRGLVALVVEHVPGGGLVRDAQKLVAPLALALAIGFGVGVEWLLGLLAPARTRRVAAVLLVAAPVLVLPALAWGAGGRLGTARYPASWTEARAAMEADPVPGAVLVLPWQLYVAFPWNGGRVSLQPAQRFFNRRAVTNDDLELRGTTVPGEDPWSPRLAPLVTGAGAIAPGLPTAGVRWVLVEKVGRWSGYPPRLAGADLVLDRADLALYRSAARPAGPPGAVVPAWPDGARAAVLGADAVALGLALWAVGGTSMARPLRRLVDSWRSRRRE